MGIDTLAGGVVSLPIDHPYHGHDGMFRFTAALYRQHRAWRDPADWVSTGTRFSLNIIWRMGLAVIARALTRSVVKETTKTYGAEGPSWAGT